MEKETFYVGFSKDTLGSQVCKEQLYEILKNPAKGLIVQIKGTCVVKDLMVEMDSFDVDNFSKWFAFYENDWNESVKDFIKGYIKRNTKKQEDI